MSTFDKPQTNRPGVEGLVDKEKGLLQYYYPGEEEDTLQASLERRRLKLAQTRLGLQPPPDPPVE